MRLQHLGLLFIVAIFSSGCEFLAEVFRDPNSKPDPNGPQYKICQRGGMSANSCYIRPIDGYCGDAPNLLGTYKTHLEAENALQAFRNKQDSNGIAVCGN